jgi:hypothetical protein
MTTLAPDTYVKTMARTVSEAKQDIGPAGPWAIADADGITLVDGYSTRAEAVRRLGRHVSAEHPLPLRVLSPSGAWSGDSIG